MEEKLKKYAQLILNYCLKLKQNQPLFIVGNTLNHDFMKLLKNEAENMGVEVFLQEINKYQERELLLSSSYEECIESSIFDCHLYNEMALRGGAVLSLTSPIPHINDGVDANLLGRIMKELERRISVFREKQMKGEVSWCIVAAANEVWAKKLFPKSKTALEDLWNVILDICFVEEENPELEWKNYFGQLHSRMDILNQMEICTLHFRSDNGTDINIELPEHYLFASARMNDIIVNMPSLELFTTPRRDGVNGVVKSSKPLLYQNVLIDDFWLRFEHGKVVDYGASIGFEMLKQIIENDEGSHYLGEVALVDYDSKINQTGILFETTLFDENASCHFAVGQGFPECFQEGISRSTEELVSMGMNQSKIHVDFMIGTRDLEIVATLQDGTEVLLMKNGKLIF